MKLILYYILYCSSMEATTFDVTGTMTFDMKNMKAYTYVYDIGNVTWDITYHNLYYDKKTKEISKGMIELKWGEIRSMIIVKDDIIKQDINGVETILMAKNKNANIKLYPEEVQQAKEDALELIRWAQQNGSDHR